MFFCWCLGGTPLRSLVDSRASVPALAVFALSLADSRQTKTSLRASSPTRKRRRALAPGHHKVKSHGCATNIFYGAQGGTRTHIPYGTRS